MSNSYGQQWNQFNFSNLQLEHGFDYNLQGSQRQRQQQQQQLQQQNQLNYTAHQYQTPTPPQSSSSLHGAFTMPTNPQLPTQGLNSPPQYGNGIQHDYASNPYANQQQQPSATRVPASNSYLPNTFNFSSSSRGAASSAMNLDAPQSSNTFLTPQGSEAHQRQSYHLPPSTSRESIPHAKRARSVAYNDELNPEDADLDSEPGPSDQKESVNRPKL